MKIGIDLKPFSTGSKFRGIGMYARELIKEMLQMDDTTEYHFLNMYEPYDCDPEIDEKCYLHQYYLGPKIIDVGEKQLFRDERTEKIREAYVRHFIEKSKIDVMLFTSPNEYGGLYQAEWFQDVFTVGILYDLIPLVFPEQCLFDKTYKEDYQNSLKFIKNLDLLLAISQSAKEDAIRLLGIPEEKIAVIYAGIDEEFRKLPMVKVEKLKKKYDITGGFILFAGGIDFKKNITGLIRAYSKMKKVYIKKYQLVIVGKAAQDVINLYMETAREYGVEDRVICTGFIPKEDLIVLYNITDIMVFPSFYEGFGLPVIEAMACGARVITSDCSSLAEIAKGYATLVNPKKERSITKGMEYVLEHIVETMNMAEKAITYARGFTWKKVAQRTFREIEKNYKTNKKFYIEKEKRLIYQLEITDQLLHNIACLFGEKILPFSEREQMCIGEELAAVSKHENLSVIRGNSRILYDVTVVKEWIKSNYSTGIGRVSKELYQALSKICQVILVTVCSENNKFVCYIVDRQKLETTQTKITFHKNDIFFMPEIQLRGVQVSYKHPYARVLKEKGIRCYAVLYDILPIQFPEYFEKKTVKSYKPYVEELLNNYNGILSDSKSVSDELLEYNQSREKKGVKEKVKIGYFHLGQNSFSVKNTTYVRKEIEEFFQLSEDVFFMLGTIEPRKGHSFILKAFEKMWKEGKDISLCMMGNIGWNRKEFIEKLKKHPEQKKRLLFIEAATDDEVQYAYKNTTALIQASAGEGFGLPLIEASQYGVPILCSNIPVFHEVAGSHAIYFNRKEENIDSVIQAVEEFFRLREIGKLPDSSCINKVTWEDAAQKVYQMIVEDINWYKIIE